MLIINSQPFIFETVLTREITHFTNCLMTAYVFAVSARSAQQFCAYALYGRLLSKMKQNTLISKHEPT